VIVLGIDPGTAALGYGIVDRAGGRLREVDHGCLVTSPDHALPDRLLEIHALVDELLELHQPDLIAVERLFFSKNVQTAFAVGRPAASSCWRRRSTGRPSARPPRTRSKALSPATAPPRRTRWRAWSSWCWA
jgi:crossover junction endodeoxyribonuclease RuvC